LGELHLELGTWFVGHGRDPDHDVARHQPQDEPVRVLEDDGVVDGQAQRGGGRPGRHDGASRVWCLHRIRAA
jgi:hypothetical protein